MKNEITRTLYHLTGTVNSVTFEDDKPKIEKVGDIDIYTTVLITKEKLLHQYKKIFKNDMLTILNYDYTTELRSISVEDFVKYSKLSKRYESEK